MNMNILRRKRPARPVPMDTRRVNLTELGQSSDTLSSRIDWPDLLRPLDVLFATAPVDADPVVDETAGLIDSAAPLVDEFTADSLNGWLDEHLPGWRAHTDYEAKRRMDVQRTLIAEITQNYAVVAARIGYQRNVVAQLDAVVESADRILAGLVDTPADPADAQTAPQSAVAPMTLPNHNAFGHPDLSAPTLHDGATTARGQQFSVVGDPTTDLTPDTEPEGEVA